MTRANARKNVSAIEPYKTMQNKNLIQFQTETKTAVISGDLPLKE